MLLPFTYSETQRMSSMVSSNMVMDRLGAETGEECMIVDWQ